MKIELREKEKNTNQYPWIGKNPDRNENIVLFCKPGCGTILHPGIGDLKIGYYTEAWIEAEFENYDGEVILSNGD